VAFAAYGALAGACSGEEGLPENWRRRLAGSEQLMAVADALFVASRMR
jgi:ADP-ribosylglycohydrolase